ncbi:MAG: hypothetical protein GXO91_10165 [FCB group bacterium]|nr:hypothetical protein [FCB group bacterium]
MKNKLLLFGAVVTLIFASYSLVQALKKPAHPPAPTEIVLRNRERQDFKRQREEYIESMHKTAPGTDWHRIDAETRRQKWLEKTVLRQIWKNSHEPDLEKPASVRFGNRDIEGTWSERGSNNQSGRMLTTAVDYENGLLYCASSGGNIWRGTLDGENWESLTDYYQIKGISLLRFVSTATADRLLIGTRGQHFYYSDDEGFTIQEAAGLDNLQNWGWTQRVIVRNDDTHTIYLLSTEWDYAAWQQISVLRKSTDQGGSFQTVSILTETMSGSFDIWTPRYADAGVYLQNDNEIYSIGENDLFSPVGSIPTANSGDNLLTGGMNGNAPFLYARVGNDIFYSPNGGHAWQWQSTAPTGTFMNNSFNCSNINPQYVFIAGVELYKSSDHGVTWQVVNNWWEYYGQESNRLHADIPEIRFFITPTGEEVAYVSTDGGVYESDDYLQSVNNLSLNGLGVSQYYSTYTTRFEPYHVYAGAQDQGYQRNQNDQGGILDFEQVISGDYGHLVSGDNGASIWCDYPGFVLFYPNATSGSNGLTWDFVGSDYLWLPPLLADPFDPEVAYLAGGGVGGNHIIRLEASAGYIDYQQLPYGFGGTVSAMAISPIDQAYSYVLTTEGQFYTSVDYGGEWQLSTGFSGPGSHYFYGSTIHPSSTQLGTVYIGGSGYSNPAVYLSEDNGITFTPITDGLPGTLVFELAATEDESILFAATEAGPYGYVPDEGVWYDLAGIFAPDQTYWSVDYIPQIATARFGTYGRGIWDFTLEGFYWIEPGDVNQDDIINVMDVIIVINIILENTDPSDEMLFAADVNADGNVNIQDIILIVNIILHL